VPPEIFGILTSSNRATITVSNFLYCTWVIVPRLEFQRETLQIRLVPEYDRRLILDYVSPVMENKEFILEVAKAAPWSLSTDEWRELADRESLGEELGGNLHPIPFNVMFGSLTDAQMEGNGGGLLGRLKHPGVRWKVPEFDEDLSFIAIHQIAHRLEPRMRDVFLGAVDRLRGRMPERDIAAAIASGQLGQIENIIPFDDFAQDLRGATEATGSMSVFRSAFSQAGEEAARILGDEIQATLSFDLTNPRAIGWIRSNVAEMVVEVTDSTRAAIRAIVERSFEEGRNVDQVARDLRQVIGLTTREAEMVERLRRRLEAEGFDLELLEARVERFYRASIRRRARRIARTEMINASSGGQQELWIQSRDNGFIKADTKRQWIVTDDDRLDTVVCEPMDGQQVGLEEPFTTGDGRKVMQPTAHPMCRCAMRLRLRQ
jgi:hypothetical protein